ncbi:MAG: glycosyltransferase [Terracidiphilus sp.]
MDPLVSLVIPCYKHAHFLSECVTSILAQTHQNFEILIMDNCSPDNTPEVARSFHDPRVRYFRNEVNIGHVRNFNKGIMMSRGKFVCLVPADDYLRNPDVLDRFVKILDRNPHVGYVFSRAFEVQGTKEIGIAHWTDCGNRDRIWNGSTFLKRLIKSDCIVMASAMVRKECFDKIALLSVDLPHACDWYLWCLFALHYQVAYVSQPMVCCRIHEESLTTSLNRDSAPICIVDELNVLWRVALEAERAARPSFRSLCNASIANHAAHAIMSGPAGATRAGLNEQEFEAMVRVNARDAKDKNDLWASVYRVLGDEQYWDGHPGEAMRSYSLALKLRPWRPKVWAKYILLWTGQFGTIIRRLCASSAVAARLKEHP